MRGAESGGRRGGFGNAADLKHDIPRAPLFIEPTLVQVGGGGFA